MSRRLAISLLFALLLVPPPSAHGPVRANMASPVQPGDPVGEPLGPVADLVIEHETLVLDLRPQGRLAQVQVTYTVRNPGEARLLPLVFVAAQWADAPFDVTVNGKAVEAARLEDAPLPPSWRTPTNTPPLGNMGGGLPLETSPPSQLRFDAPIEPGVNTLRVQYSARPGAYNSSSAPTVYRQLAYVLAPARQWGGFGGLDVTVHLPPGWRVASDPPLQRQGDTLSGSFDEIPANALALTFQLPPSPWHGILQWLRWLAGLGGLLLCAWLGIVLGKNLRRKAHSRWWSLPAALGLALATTLLLVLLLVADVDQEQLSNAYSYGRGTAAVLLMPLYFLVAYVVAQTAALVGHRRAGHHQPEDDMTIFVEGT